MRILAPLNESCEISGLAREADEFYAGVVDEAWEKDGQDIFYYNTRGNRRGGVNFRSWGRLAEAVQEAAQQGCPVYLTMNGHNLGPDRLACCRRILERFARIGGTGVISANLSCLAYGKELGLKTSVSTILGLYNTEAVAWLERTAAPDRIILSRDMTLEEIRAVRKSTRTPIEVFGMKFGCKFSNGFCLGSHNHPTSGLCHAVGQMHWTYTGPDGRVLPPEGVLAADRNHWYYTNALLEQACGVCAFYDLIQMQVDCVKLVGRELPGEEILAAAAQMQSCIRLAEESPSREAYLSRLDRRKIQTGRYGCEGGFSCYYPECRNQKDQKF